MKTVRSLLWALALGLVSAACSNQELEDACAEYCVQRAACDLEKGVTPSDNCESYCVGWEDEDFVARHEACMDETACAYAVCVAE